MAHHIALINSIISTRWCSLCSLWLVCCRLTLIFRRNSGLHSPIVETWTLINWCLFDCWFWLIITFSSWDSIIVKISTRSFPIRLSIHGLLWVTILFSHWTRISSCHSRAAIISNNCRHTAIIYHIVVISSDIQQLAIFSSLLFNIVWALFLKYMLSLTSITYLDSTSTF
jgi:hypothetical protein